MVTTGEGEAQRSVLLSTRAPESLGLALELVSTCLDDAELSFGHGTDNSWDEAVQLVLAAAELPADSGTDVLDLPVGDEVWSRIRALTEQRVVDRQPLPYLIGRAWFAGLPFHCDERALVPRSPLAEVILGDYAPWWNGAAPKRLLDLCCGGGAIGIAAAVHDPKLAVVLTDIDADALALAETNIVQHELGVRVQAVQGDLFSGVAGERFDIILSNPPYVNADDLASMPAEYHAEPPLGLGSGHDGLDLSRRILCSAAAHLEPGGLLFLEVGNSWVALDALLSALPLTWLEFREGGHGVLLVRAEELPAIVSALDSR